MMISAGDVASYATSGFFLLAVGGAVGRQWGTSKKHKTAEDDALHQLTWAVGGKPADQWNHERVPGLIEQMTSLRTQFAGNNERNLEMFSQLLRRMEVTEASVAEAAAKAAKAVLDTARKVSYESSDAAAEAAAVIIATAIEAKLALTHPKE